ncbi:amino acid transporter [Delitschia confertaspora ATCC 74209]|uniref:Amino acid transporter n=1 Tax=Delitschia confertaspora ATCC 74209 TaxID=1513339 RepID=A0A9P4JSX2_9PLEO|nr:amino acid transporter [Delitschia confertaspora ATCC 74209]
MASMAATPEPGMFDREDLIDLEFDNQRMRKEYTPSRQEKIKPFTVACLILNRSIGSGIFATPSKILQATNSVGISILFWALGGILISCGTLVWTEFGLSTPREHVDGKERAVPRSGGEKNYLEWVLQKPKFLATCMYGIVFILLGNLSGNAIQFGRYVLLASGHDNPTRGPVIGLAIAALTIVVLVHTVSRKGGILMNNAFAILKVCILLTIIILGFAVRGGANFRDDNKRRFAKESDLAPSNSFADAASGLASYSSTFLYVLYAYSGFEQPFYILSEVDRPRRNFARAVIPSMALLTGLFILVNVAYVCVVPMDDITNSDNADLDLASVFFEYVFGNDTAKHTMQALIACSILGNLIVMTFTAARVKQEIAKEGILPKSLLFATGKTTPTAKLLSKFRKSRGAKVEYIDGHEHLEQSPMAALGLHWLSSIFLIAVTAKLSPDDAYSFLVSLYAYVFVSVMGVFTSFGLLYSKYWRKDFVSRYQIWGGPTAAIIYCLFNAFLVVTAFLNPPGSLARTTSVMPNYVVPSIGLSTILWGVVWWLGLHLVMKQRGQRLVVTRSAFCDRPDDNGEWVLKYEIIDHVWKADSDAGSVRTGETEMKMRRRSEGGN